MNHYQIHCHKCGMLTVTHTPQDKTNYCPVCGNKLPKPDQSNKPKISNKKINLIFSLKEVESRFTRFGFEINRFRQSKDFIKLNEEYWIAEYAAKGNYIDVRSKNDNS